MKEAMELVGLNAGVTREPVAAINEQDKKALESLVRSWGVTISKGVMIDVEGV